MVLTHELGYWFDRFVGKSSKERSVHLSRNMFSAYLSIEPGAGLLLTDIRSGIKNRGRAALLILLLMERHKKDPIKHARSLSKPLLAYQVPLNTVQGKHLSIVIVIHRLDLSLHHIYFLPACSGWLG